MTQTQSVLQSSDSAESWLDKLGTHASRYLLGYFVLYALFGVLTVGIYPSFSFPSGDEGTYLDYASHPWTLTSDFFEGFRPKEVQNPYNARLFLNPFSLLFSVFGFTHIGARLLCFGYGMVVIWLVFRLAATLAVRGGASEKLARAMALMVAIVFSMQPMLLYFTHGIRPEIMFTLFMLLCTWVLVRRDDGPNPRTWGMLGLLSSSMLMVHYNGVTAPLLFFAAAWYHDRGKVTRTKILAFVGGGVGFVLVFLLVNFLPALDTVREFGVMPVTFVSKNEIPIIQSFNPLEPIISAVSFYRDYWISGSHFEPFTGPFTSLLLIPTILAVGSGANRSSRTILVIAALMITLLVFVIPNRRHAYLFYVIPLFFITGSIGLTRLPAGKLRTWVSVLGLATLLVPYVWSNSREISRFANWKTHNDDTNQALQSLAMRLGGDRPATVMASQEFRAAIPNTRFRTFHSLIRTKDLEKSLELIKPDIVVLHLRSIKWLGWISGIFEHLPEQQRGHAAREYSLRTLREAGYQAQSLPGVPWHGSYSWDDSRVFIFVKRR